MADIFKFLRPRDSFQATSRRYKYVELKGGIGMTITDLRGNPLASKPVLLSRPSYTGRERSGWNWFIHG